MSCGDGGGALRVGFGVALREWGVGVARVPAGCARWLPVCGEVGACRAVAELRRGEGGPVSLPVSGVGCRTPRRQAPWRWAYLSGGPPLGGAPAYRVWAWRLPPGCGHPPGRRGGRPRAAVEGPPSCGDGGLRFPHGCPRRPRRRGCRRPGNGSPWCRREPGGPSRRRGRNPSSTLPGEPALLDRFGSYAGLLRRPAGWQSGRRSHGP